MKWETTSDLYEHIGEGNEYRFRIYQDGSTGPFGLYRSVKFKRASEYYIGYFKTLDAAKTVAELIDKG